MGQIYEFKDKGAVKFIEEVIDATDLKQHEDFEIVSFIVLDEDMDSFSLGEFVDTTSNRLFSRVESDFAEEVHTFLENEGMDYNSVFATQYHNDAKVSFFKMKGEVNIDLATELGLGVVKLKGEYLLYSPFYESVKDSIAEMIRLKVYAQLANPNVIDNLLSDGFEKSREMIESLIVLNSEKHMLRLEQIYTSGV